MGRSDGDEQGTGTRGTRKGAFILSSDGKREKWDISGPHFAGWEIYHMKGSPLIRTGCMRRKPPGGSGRSFNGPTTAARPDISRERIRHSRPCRTASGREQQVRL